MTKMTYVDALDLAIEHLDSPEAVARLTALRDTLIKRAQTPRKPSAKAREARNFRELVEDYILNKGYATFTAKELAQELNTTTQRVTAALTALVKIGVFVKGDGWYEVAGE
jgi:Fic family protein